MSEYILFAIFLFYNVAVFLDFRSQTEQFKILRESNKIARSFIARNRIGFVARGMSFLLAPLLGIAVSTLPPDIVAKLFVYCAVSGAIICSFQLLTYSSTINEMRIFASKLGVKNLIHMTPGIVCFSIFVNVAFFLNLVASKYSDFGLAIVQLTPALTALGQFYIIFIYDKAISTSIDEGGLTSSNEFSWLLERLLGRFLAVALALTFVNLL